MATKEIDQEAKLRRRCNQILRRAHEILKHARGAIDDRDVATRAVELCQSVVDKLEASGAKGTPRKRLLALTSILSEFSYSLDEDQLVQCVFRTFLAMDLKIDTPDELSDQAIKVYENAPDLYNLLFEPIISRKVRDLVSSRRYWLNSNPTALQDWAEFEMIWQGQAAEDTPGLSTSLPTLDTLTGGLSGLTVVAGHAGSGKTSLAVDLISRVLQRSSDVCALLMSLEISKNQAYTKFLSRDLNVPFNDLIKPNAVRLQEGGVRLKSILPRLRVIDTPHQQVRNLLTEDYILTQVHDLIKFTGTKNCFVVIDSFDKIVPGHNLFDENCSYDKSYDLVADKARLDILLAAQHCTRQWNPPFGCPFLVLTRVRKNGSGSGHLKLADVIGSVDIVHDADCVLLLEKLPQQRSSSPESDAVISVRLNVAKIRDIGRLGEANLDFHFQTSRFEESQTATKTRRGKVNPRRSENFCYPTSRREIREVI